MNNHIQVKTTADSNTVPGSVESKSWTEKTPANVKPAALNQYSNEQGVWVLLGKSLEQAERALIEHTLASVGHNKSKAARILGVSRKTILNKLKKYGSN